MAMVEGKDPPTPKEEKETRWRTWQREPGWRPPWWKRFWERLWGWTGFGETKLWDWLQLLGTLAIPVVVAEAAAWFSSQQATR
jgi:hypothetical protein